MKNISLCLIFLLQLICVSPLFAQSIPVVDKKERKDRKLKILVLSDLNDSYGSTSYSQELSDLMGRINQINPDIILCAGDMVAGQKKSLTRLQIQAMWEAFHKTVLQPIKSYGIPFGFTMGNHDASPGFALDRELSARFWQEHKQDVGLTFVDDSHYPYYYSYIKHNVFMISWDASSSKIPEEVKTWMKGQLDSDLAQQARFRILLGHLPLYALVEAKNKAGEVIDQADQTLDFLKENKVDLYLSGHQHAYYPATKEGMLLYHSAALGGGPRRLIGSQLEPYKAYGIIEVPKKIKPRQQVKMFGFHAQTNRPVDHQLLPKQVSGFNGSVQRVD